MSKLQEIREAHERAERFFAENPELRPHREGVHEHLSYLLQLVEEQRQALEEALDRLGNSQPIAAGFIIAEVLKEGRQVNETTE